MKPPMGLSPQVVFTHVAFYSFNFTHDFFMPDAVKTETAEIVRTSVVTQREKFFPLRIGQN